MLAELGIPPERVLPIAPSERIRVEDLLLPSLMTRSSLIHPAALNWLRSRFPPRLQGDEPQRIYVSRSRATKRRLRDEDALASILSECWFATIYAEELPFRMQVPRFPTAKRISAP